MSLQLLEFEARVQLVRMNFWPSFRGAADQ